MADNISVLDATGTAKTIATTDNGSGVHIGNTRVTDATKSNFLPSGDAPARKIFVTVTDGTGTQTFDNINTTPRVSLYGKGTAAGDTPLPSLDTAAHAGFVKPTDGTNSPAYGVLNVDFTATSPASAITTAQTAVTGLGGYRSMTVYANIQGGTGGTLDIYLQMSPDGGTTWVDYAHFTQLAAGAAAVQKYFSVSKSAQQTTITAVGSGTTPALAANTVLGGDWGDRLRVVFVAGASTSAGASQTIKAVLSP